MTTGKTPCLSVLLPQSKTRKLNSTIVFETFISSEIPWLHSRIFIIGSHLGGGRYRECLFVIGWEAGVRALGSVER